MGEVGVPGTDSSADVDATASLVDGLWPAGTQNVSFIETGLRFDDLKLVVSIVSTLYGIAPPTSRASWLSYTMNNNLLCFQLIE